MKGNTLVICIQQFFTIMRCLFQKKNWSSLNNWIAISHSVPFFNVAHVPNVVCNNDRFLTFPLTQKLLSVGSLCIFVNMCTSCSSFQTNAVRLSLTLECVSPNFNFNILLSRCLSTPLQFCHTVPQQLTPLVYRSSYVPREDRKLSLYSLWPIPSTLQVTLLTVTYVAVIVCAAFCLSLFLYILLTHSQPAILLCLNAMQCNAMQCNAMQCLSFIH